MTLFHEVGFGVHLCPDCKAPCRRGRMVNGHKVRIDAEPVPEGPIVFTTPDDIQLYDRRLHENGWRRYRVHTCPATGRQQNLWRGNQ